MFYCVACVFDERVCFLVQLTPVGPLQSHLDPPSAPSCPKVTIFYDFGGYLGVTLELIFGTSGVLFDAPIPRTEKAGFGQALRIRSGFSSIWGPARRCSGEFSLQRELCFHFGGQWQTMSTLGSILESFWDPKAQLYSLWGLPV